MWNKYINNSSFKSLEIEKNDQVSGCEKWQKMTENDTKWHKNDWKWDGWLKHTWKIWKEVIRTVNDQKLQKLTKCHHEKKWQKITKNDPEGTTDMF